MSSLRFTGFVFLVLLFCLFLNVSFPFAQSVREMEENPQLIKKSVLKISSRTSLRVNKGLLPQYEVSDDFAENGSKEGGAAARKMRNLLRDNSEVKNSRETGEEVVGSLHGKQRSISEGADEKLAGFTGNTVKVGLDVHHRLRPRSKRKGKGGGDLGYAGGFVAFNADYHFPRQHPPRNN